VSISAGTDFEKSWDETTPGQGWIYSQPFYGSRPTSSVISWTDDASREKTLNVLSKAGKRKNADVYIELKPHGDLAWRIVDRPADEGDSWAIISLLPVYAAWCVLAALVIGVPLALAAFIAFLLFQTVRVGLGATVQGLRGDRTVFQFTIREVLFLMTMVALALGWLVHIWATTNR